MNLYQLLNLPSHSDRVTVKKAYREKIKEIYPSVLQGNIEAEELWKELNLAYEAWMKPSTVIFPTKAASPPPRPVYQSFYMNKEVTKKYKAFHLKRSLRKNAIWLTLYSVLSIGFVFMVVQGGNSTLLTSNFFITIEIFIVGFILLNFLLNPYRTVYGLENLRIDLFEDKIVRSGRGTVTTLLFFEEIKIARRKKNGWWLQKRPFDLFDRFFFLRPYTVCADYFFIPAWIEDFEELDKKVSQKVNS